MHVCVMKLNNIYLRLFSSLLFPVLASFPLIHPHNITPLSPSSLLSNLSFTHPNAIFCIIPVLGPFMAARCLFMDCTNDKNDMAGGWGLVTHEIGKDYKTE